MNEIVDYLKDFIVVLTPIIVAILTYRSNKKSKREIKLEIEKMLSEKDADTSQMLQRVYAELDSQKQLSTWNNSFPQTEDYIKLAGTKRYGNICSISQLSNTLSTYIDNNDLSREEIQEIRSLVSRIELPQEEEELYPYEICHIIKYNKLVRKLESLLNSES